MVLMEPRSPWLGPADCRASSSAWCEAFNSCATSAAGCRESRGRRAGSSHIDTIWRLKVSY